MKKYRRLQDVYRFPGYRPKAAIKGIFGDPKSVVLELVRLQKKRYADVAAPRIGRSTTGKSAGYGIYHAETSVCTLKLRSDACSARSVDW